MIDAHLHLVQYPRAERDALLQRWQEQGLRQVVAVATDLRSSCETLYWKQRYPELVIACLGYHPEQPPPSERESEEIVALVRQERALVSAIGEVGLPHYKLGDLGSGALTFYEERLAFFTKAAVDMNLPLVLHAVHDKARLALDTLQANGSPRAHFHWLKAPDDVVEAIIADGHYISVTPEVCYRERDQHLTRRVPLANLLLETDGPWPYDGPFRGRETTPLFVREVAKTVAALKGVTLEALMAQQAANIAACYGNDA